LAIENQTIVQQGFERLKAVAGESIKRRENESYQTFVDSGGVIYEPSPYQKKMFQDAAQGMRTWYSKTYGDEWLLKVDSKVESCKAKAE
jgi:TRAP-type C4-dicarboxylate transport system substrate-binding protein